MNENRARKETLPNQPLVRFIDDCYCDSFVKEGRVRFGSITKYSTLNDTRADATESVAMFKNEHGSSTTKSVMNEAVFILSCSRGGRQMTLES